MAAQHPACPLCGHDRTIPIPAYAQHHLVRCTSCSFVHAGLEPSIKELEAYYSGYPIKDANQLTLQRYDELLARFAPYRKLNTLLDVGCGAGDLLARAAVMGWEVHGTEYGEAFLEVCNAKGIAMRQGPLDAANYGDLRFDMIVSLEVLEHLPHPVDMVRQAAALLRPGGVMYMTTPNYDAFSRHLAGADWNIVNYPEHISLFTARTIHKLFSDQGLKKLSLQTTGISPARLQGSLGKAPAASGPRNADDDLREKLEGSAMLRSAKYMANGLLSILRKGDTLKATYVKPLP